jgi:phosphocarrier protein HPr
MPVADRQAKLDGLKASFTTWTAADWLRGQLSKLGIEMPVAKRPRVPVPSVPESGTQVAEQQLTVLNHGGLHARPAAAFVRCARSFDCKIEILRDGQIFSAQSIFGVLSANLTVGTVFALRAYGAGADEAVAALAGMLDEFRRQDA